MDKEDSCRLRYDPGEHRRKHCWTKDYAEIVPEGSASVGKCPATLSKEQAEILLNEALCEKGTKPVSRTERLWTVHDGVIYEAVSSLPGVYHGYPWQGRPGRNRLSRPVKRALLERAREQGCELEVKDWLKRHES